MSATEAIRWNLSRAADEFGVSRHKLRSGLMAINASPENDDATYSTRQICAAIYGDQHGEKTRLAREQADKLELENKERRGSVINVDETMEVLHRFCHAIRQQFLATSLSAEEKSKVLLEIQRLEEANFIGESDTGAAAHEEE